jgi:glucuronokinase
MIVESQAYARAGLLGNPSDKYFGKAISISIKNFRARVSLCQSPELQIEALGQDLNIYKDIQDLAESIDRYGYYGGERLVKAAIKKFYEYCLSQNISLQSKNFTLQYDSDIPRQVGLGGSSAIVTAALKGLMKFYGVSIPKEYLPSLILEAELGELGISAGFQDRVIQVYEGCVYMNLDAKVIQDKGHGIYERLDPKLLPDLYLAYKPMLGKVSGKVLNEIDEGFEKRDPFVIKTLNQIAELAEEGKRALFQRNKDRLFDLMNENFDLRRKIMTISEGNLEMIRTARSCGASAKFAGSGGSVIGIHKGEEMYNSLLRELEMLQAKVIKPIIQ